MPVNERTFSYSLEEVYNASIEALRSTGFEISEKKPNSIKASTGFSLRSWGEDIYVEFFYSSNGTQVRVSSFPKFQIFDLGKSEENISKIISEIEKHLRMK